MKLLGQQTSINVRKVLWTCLELGLSPECEDWGGTAHVTPSADILSINPKGLVPVLIDGDLVLTESNTICRYLAAREGRTDLLPEEPKRRALVEAWMDWQATDLNTAWRSAFMSLVRRNPNYAEPARQLQSIQDWNTAMSLLDAQLAECGPYICGDSFTLADIVLALSTNRWELTPFERPTLHAIDAWMTRLSQRVGFNKFCRNGTP